MRRNFILCLIAVLLVAIGTFALRIANTANDADVDAVSTDNSENTNYMDATYPSYATLGDLAASSSLVVRGKVTRLLPSYKVVPDSVPLNQLPAYKADNVGYLMTDAEIQIQHVVVGAPELVGTTITVSHMGGELNGQKYVMKDEPLSQRGRSYVFFLQQSASGHYVILGGPQGRYRVSNGKLTSLSKDAQHYPINTRLEGMALTNLEQNFQQVVALQRQEQQQQRQQVEADETLNTQPGMSAPSDKPQGPPQN